MAAQAKQARQQAIAEVRAEKQKEQAETGERRDAATGGTAGDGAANFTAARLREAVGAYGRIAGILSGLGDGGDGPRFQVLIA